MISYKLSKYDKVVSCMCTLTPVYKESCKEFFLKKA